MDNEFKLLVLLPKCMCLKVKFSEVMSETFNTTSIREDIRNAGFGFAPRAQVGMGEGFVLAPARSGAAPLHLGGVDVPPRPLRPNSGPVPATGAGRFDFYSRLLIALLSLSDRSYVLRR